MKKISNDFLKLCELIGSQIPFWTQGQGGNISEKIGNYMSIKASGFRLDQVRKDRGITQVQLKEFISSISKLKDKCENAETQYAELLKNSSSENGLRPSMETGMHSFCEKKFVCHFHSLTSLLMYHIYSQNPFSWDEFVLSLPSQLRLEFEFIEATIPGLELSFAVGAHSTADCILLENHGVILQFDAPSVLEAWRDIENLFMLKFYSKWSNSKALAAPFKIYFPDAAVFRERVERLLEPKGEYFSLIENAFEVDRDAAEIFWASSLLYQMEPSLKQLPESISNVIGSLPTEKFRKNETSSCS